MNYAIGAILIGFVAFMLYCIKVVRQAAADADRIVTPEEKRHREALLRRINE